MAPGTWRAGAPQASTAHRLQLNRAVAAQDLEDPDNLMWLSGSKTQASCCQCISSPRCAATSAWQRAILQVAWRYFDPLGRKRLGNDPALRRASAQRMICQRIKSGLGEANGQHGRPVRTCRVRNRRWLLWSSRARCLQHLGRGEGRGNSGALQSFHQGVPKALVYCVLLSSVWRPASGSQPRLRSSANRAFVSALALPPGMRPEKPISP